MFFAGSKIAWFIGAPTNALTVLAFIGTVCLFTRFAKLGRALALVGVGGLVLFGASPFSRSVMRILEDRFPIVADEEKPVDGIIVLGGAVGSTRGQVRFTDAAARMTAAVELVRHHPAARLVFSGGDAGLMSFGRGNEATAAKVLLVGLGVPEERILLEDQSRNTRENAVFTKALVKPAVDERWLLITSAYHMPRAIGSFRMAGFDVVPYPVDFHSRGRPNDFLRPHGTFSEGLRLGDLAIKEWIGLLAYRVAGYTDELVPGPRR